MLLLMLGGTGLGLLPSLGLGLGGGRGARGAARGGGRAAGGWHRPGARTSRRGQQRDAQRVCRQTVIQVS